MRNLKLIFIIFLFNLLMNASSKACNLLNIDIGADKSTVEDIFGTIEDEDISDFYNVTKFYSPIEFFCEELELGNALINGYILNKKVGAVEIEVQNGPDNEESKSKLVRNYVIANFGSVDPESKDWQGYKMWEIENKQVYYFYRKYRGYIYESVAVTNSEFYRALADDE